MKMVDVVIISLTIYQVFGINYVKHHLHFKMCLDVDLFFFKLPVQ